MSQCYVAEVLGSLLGAKLLGPSRKAGRKAFLLNGTAVNETDA